MVAAAFTETFTVPHSGHECWDVLVDVPRISSWVSVVGQVTEHERLASYSAVLEDRLGPFRLRADLGVEVVDVVEPERISIRADGEDRQVGSRITVEATLVLQSSDESCDVTIEGNYEVTGRVATMGAATIRQKAEKLIEEFVEAARRDLA